MRMVPFNVTALEHKSRSLAGLVHARGPVLFKKSCIHASVDSPPPPYLGVNICLLFKRKVLPVTFEERWKCSKHAKHFRTTKNVRYASVDGKGTPHHPV